MNPAIAELLFRILCDTLPETGTERAYLFAETAGNQDSGLRIAAGLKTERVMILQTGGRCGYTGYTEWFQCLKTQGVPRERIEGVTMAEEIQINSRTESQALIRHAKACGYRSLLIVAPPFHQLRAFMTAVTVALEEYPELALYSRPGMAQPWTAEVVHSQGILKAKRFELIHEELGRIAAYREKGDLAEFDQVLAYLNQRK